MLRSATRRRCSWFRSLWGGILLLALVLQPALATVGEIHELSHGGAAASHAAFDAAKEAVPQDRGEGGETLHFLVQFSHCCSPVSGILPAGPAPLLPPTGSASPALELLTLPLRNALEDVLRPPIQA